VSEAAQLGTVATLREERSGVNIYNFRARFQPQNQV